MAYLRKEVTERIENSMVIGDYYDEDGEYGDCPDCGCESVVFGSCEFCGWEESSHEEDFDEDAD